MRLQAYPKRGSEAAGQSEGKRDVRLQVELLQEGTMLKGLILDCY